MTEPSDARHRVGLGRSEAEVLAHNVAKQGRLLGVVGGGGGGGGNPPPGW
jgi:hypothetical protein